MLKHLLAKFSTTLYMQMWEDRLKVVDVVTGTKAPFVAIGSKAQFLPSNSRLRVVNPFLPPRALINACLLIVFYVFYVAMECGICGFYLE